MPPVLQPAQKKQKTVLFYTTDWKRWLIDLRDKNPGFQHLRFAQVFRDKFGGDLLSSLTVSDWLKPTAAKRAYMPETCRKRAGQATDAPDSLFQLY